MKLTRYLYTGPQSCASLRVGEERELLDVQLLPGGEVELPADHEYTVVLLALKHLVLLPETSVVPTPPAEPVTVVEKKGAKQNGS